MKASNKLKAAQGHWNKEAIKKEDIARRKARKEARGKAWHVPSVL